MNLNLLPRGVKVYNKIVFVFLSLKKIVNRYLGLFHNRSDCPFRNIPRMIGDCGEYIFLWMMPQFITTCCLSIKPESKSFQFLDDLPICQIGKSAHHKPTIKG